MRTWRTRLPSDHAAPGGNRVGDALRERGREEQVRGLMLLVCGGDVLEQQEQAGEADDGANDVGAFGRGHEGGRRAGAGPEVADRDARGLRFPPQPVGGADEPVGQQTDVKA